MVLLFVLALVIPVGLVGFGQMNADSDSSKVVPDAAQDTRRAVDPSSQPKPDNTVAPQPARYDGITDNGEEGARTAVTYLFDTYAYMISTGDTSGWENLSAPECQQCFAFAHNAAQLHKQGGWIVGGEISLNEQKVTMTTVGEAAKKDIATGQAAPSGAGASDAGRSGNGPGAGSVGPSGASTDRALANQPFATVEASFTEAPATLVDNPSREPMTRNGSKGTFLLTMRHNGKRWLVTSMAVK